MENYNPKETVVIKKFLECIEDDVDNAIEFLVEGLHFDQDEIEEMGSYEIIEKVREEVIDEIDYDTFCEAVVALNIEGFESENVYFVNDNDDNSMIADGELRKPCKKPCPTCPYTQKAVSGDFGGHNSDIYADAINQDTVIACHSRTKHNNETGLPNSHGDITICTGHIVTQIKTCKTSRHPDGAKAHDFIRGLDNFEELKENALGFDFKAFHGI